MHSIAFKLGGLEVHWYGILVAVGFLAGLWTASKRAVKDGLSAEAIGDLGPWIILGAILGARTLYVFSYWREDFAGKPWYEVFMVQHGGLVFYGGLIGATLAVILYSLGKRLPLWKVGDALAPSIALGYVFGRIGCLMNGCCYGRPCDLPWAIRFPPHKVDGVMEPHPSGGGPVHPTQIYDSLLNLGFYLFLAWLYRRKKFDGQVFATYLIGYALLRSFVEYFRGDYPVHYLGGWATPAQLVSMGIILGGLLLMFLLPRPAVKRG